MVFRVVLAHESTGLAELGGHAGRSLGPVDPDGFRQVRRHRRDLDVVVEDASVAPTDGRDRRHSGRHRDRLHQPQ